MEWAVRVLGQGSYKGGLGVCFGFGLFLVLNNKKGPFGVYI